MTLRLIRVAADSSPHAVAGAIAGQVRTEGRAITQAIGPRAVSQMVKAAAIATQFLGEENRRVTCVPQFESITEQGNSCTAMRLLISAHNLR
jgi:stage V sporulation protein S